LRDKDIVEMDLQGNVSASDYNAVEPKLLSFFKSSGKLKFLIQLDHLNTFELGAVAADAKFGLKNIRNIGPTAIVGDKKSQALLTRFINLIFPEKVKFFESAGEASMWLNGTTT
jgi:hypothetical protein